MDHAGALGDGADAAGLAAQRELHRELLGVGVGGHDGGGGVMAAFRRGGQLGGRFGDALLEGGQFHGLADDTGGGGQDIVSGDAQRLGHQITGVVGQLDAARGTGVGVAAVHHDGLGITVLQVLPVHRDGRTIHLVGGVAAGARTAHLGLDQRQIQFGMVMPDAAVYPCGRETLGGADTARNRLKCFHGSFPLSLSTI